MKDPEQKKRDWTKIAMILCCLVIMALGGVGFLLYTHVSRHKKILTGLRKEYQDMLEFKKKIADLKRRMGGKIPALSKVEDLPGYFTQKIRDNGLAIPGLTPVRPRPWDQWTEYATILEFRGTKESPIVRSKIVDFLSRVEKERPYLKSRDLLLTFSGNDLSGANITVSYFQREKSAAR